MSYKIIGMLLFCGAPFYGQAGLKRKENALVASLKNLTNKLQVLEDDLKIAPASKIPERALPVPLALPALPSLKGTAAEEAQKIIAFVHQLFTNKKITFGDFKAQQELMQTFLELKNVDQETKDLYEFIAFFAVLEYMRTHLNYFLHKVPSTKSSADRLKIAFLHLAEDLDPGTTYSMPRAAANALITYYNAAYTSYEKHVGVLKALQDPKLKKLYDEKAALYTDLLNTLLALSNNLPPAPTLLNKLDEDIKKDDAAMQTILPKDTAKNKREPVTDLEKALEARRKALEEDEEDPEDNPFEEKSPTPEKKQQAPLGSTPELTGSNLQDVLLKAMQAAGKLDQEEKAAEDNSSSEWD